MKDFLINTSLFIVAIAAIAGATWYVSPGESVDYAEEIKILSERELIAYNLEEDIFGSVVAFVYKGDELPEKLAEDEVVEMRTESSYTKQIGFENKGTSQEKVILELISFPQQTFINENDEWYYIEHDVVPKKIFDKATKENTLLGWLVNIAYADYVVTNEKHYSGTGDGHVYYSATAGWTTARGATSGTASYSATTAKVQSQNVYVEKVGTTHTIMRIFLPFDTSSIKSTATVDSATLNVYVAAKTNTDNDGTDYIAVVRTTQAGNTTLVSADYDNIGTTVGATSIDIGSIGTGAYKAFTLNSTGRGWIAKSGESSVCPASDTGISCFGLREGHDNSNTPIATDTDNSITIRTANYTGTASDPYLSITYTVLNFAPWMFQAF